MTHKARTMHAQGTDSIEQSLNTVAEAIEWIHSLTLLGIRPGLQRMYWMLERLDNPHRKQSFIHIGGTNGKGSVVAYLRHVLQEASYTVGTFTSPYIIQFQERIQVNGEHIGDQDLLQLTRQIKPLCEQLAATELGQPTEFEVITVLALHYFATVRRPDLVLWEVGLGGRLDCTNVVHPILSIITNVGLDHQHILGDDIEQIAFEKAGIIKQNVPVVTGTDQAEALQIMIDKARQTKSELYVLNADFQVQAGPYTFAEQTFDYVTESTVISGLSIQMKGKHQLNNAALAICALQLLQENQNWLWTEADLRQGLHKTTWPGRLETVSEQPLTIIDGAHNPEGLQALSAAVKQYFPNRKAYVFFSVMKDKDMATMLSLLDGVTEQLVLTECTFPRAATLSALRAQIEGSTKPWQMSIEFHQNWADIYMTLVHNDFDGVIIFTGSLYFIAEVRAYFKNRPTLTD